jgi:hypothetical protein
VKGHQRFFAFAQNDGKEKWVEYLALGATRLCRFKRSGNKKPEHASRAPAFDFENRKT